MILSVVSIVKPMERTIFQMESVLYTIHKLNWYHKLTPDLINQLLLLLNQCDNNFIRNNT